MTNSNPSRFFISSTRYLGTRGEKAHMAEAGKHLEEDEIWGPLLHLPAEHKGLVDALLQPLLPLCLPHEPQLQTVHMAATLHHLVSSVQSHIIELVLLEEVAGLGPVATPEQVLWGESCQSGPSYSAAHSVCVCGGVSTQSPFVSLELGREATASQP